MVFHGVSAVGTTSTTPRKLSSCMDWSIQAEEEDKPRFLKLSRTVCRGFVVATMTVRNVKIDETVDAQSLLYIAVFKTNVSWIYVHESV